MKETMLIFDLDGTLWDSTENVAKSWNEVIARRAPYLKSITKDDVRSVMGKTMEEIARILFPDCDIDERQSFFDECQDYEVEYIEKHGGELFEGVRESLETLKNEGFRMAIVSNCQKGYIPAFLNSMDMGEYFCDIEEWGNTLKAKSENISLVMERNCSEKAIYIGDTQGDKDAADGALIPFIHAAYGFGRVPKADFKIRSFRELLTYTCWLE